MKHRCKGRICDPCDGACAGCPSRWRCPTCSTRGGANCSGPWATWTRSSSMSRCVAGAAQLPSLRRWFHALTLLPAARLAVQMRIGLGNAGGLFVTIRDPPTALLPSADGGGS